MQPDDTIGKRAAVVTVDLSDGRSLSCRIDNNTGTPDNPMSDAALSAKFTDNAAPVLGADRAAHVLGVLWAVDGAGSFADVVRMTGATA